jgi:hypothetical protein
MNMTKTNLYGICSLCTAGILGVLVFVLVGCGTVQPDDPLQINFAHLEHLIESTVVNGHECDIVHIYANAPSYEWTGDDDEGIACVDDVARAARLYLREYEATGDSEYADRAIRLMEFVFAMQTESGMFANFIWPNKTINDTGRTSIPSMDYWTARAVHSLAITQRVLAEYRPDIAQRAASALELPVVNLVTHYLHQPAGQSIDVGPDQIAVYTLALLERRQIQRSELEDSLITTFAAHILEHSFAGSSAFPYRVHLSWRNVWHSWGSLQVEALAAAGHALDRQDWIDSAREVCEGFQRYLLTGNGPISFSIESGDTANVHWYSQIAYNTACLTACQRVMYEITGEEEFAWGSGLAVGWLVGLNPAETIMYNSANGRCFDGINNPISINLNSGAESTIEALLALQELRILPGAPEAARSSKDPNSTPENVQFITRDNRAVLVSHEGARWNLVINDIEMDE